MGGRISRNKQIGNRPVTIVLLGLDNAGKTTTAKVLEKTSVDSVTPTIGFAQYEVRHSNEKIKLYDLGGLKTFRQAWRHYYDDPHGFIYVIDSSKEDRLDENREVLKQLLREEKIQNKPILILANKQDESDVHDKNTFLENFKIEELLHDHQSLCRVELCTAKLTNSNDKDSQIDPAIQNGFDWLIKTIYENYDTLNKRVQQDIQTRNEAEKKAKRELQEKIAKSREERAQQEDEENDDHPTTNGFIPINQAIKNAEKNSTVFDIEKTKF